MHIKELYINNYLLHTSDNSTFKNVPHSQCCEMRDELNPSFNKKIIAHKNIDDVTICHVGKFNFIRLLYITYIRCHQRVGRKLHLTQFSLA